ncbi:MAG: alanine racemase [Elusimicrobia bacterium]|nr:alanine racemase [Elusimicrobiota bacterium]
MRRFFRPTWAEVDLSALKANLRLFKSRVAGSKVMFVVKGNAYGHGAAACAKAALGPEGADCFGVSSVEEGIALREAGIRRPILVLGSLYPFESFLAAAQFNLIPTVASLESAQRLAEASRRLGRKVPCHLKIETGMGRIGLSPKAALGAAEWLSAEKSVKLSGVYTHLSCAEESPEFTARQLRLFKQAACAIACLAPAGFLRHAANSAAALRCPESRWDMVRPGLALYGLYPGFKPVLSLKSRVVFLKSVPAGTPISYGASYRAPGPRRIATIPIGYADGFSRGLSNKGRVLVQGRFCPVVGRVTMDMLMVDVTGVPRVRVGDEVVLLGSQASRRVTAGDMASELGTIAYEITTCLSARVPRVYLI